MGTIESKDVGARAKALWLPEDPYGGSPGKKDVSSLVGAADRMGFDMTVEDLHRIREEAVEADRKRWERLEGISKEDDE